MSKIKLSKEEEFTMPRHTKKVEVVVFPLQDLYIDKFFDGGKAVFIKFPTRDKTLSVN